MTDRGPLYDQDDTPEDVASLYSWANLHGAKYRDFSEARAQTREKARQRVQQAIEEEQARLQRQAQAERSASMQQAADAARIEEQERQAAWVGQQAAQLAEQHAAEQAAEKAAQEAQAFRQAAELAAQQAAEQATPQSAEQALREAAQAVRNAAEYAREQREYDAQQTPAWPSLDDRFGGPIESEPEPAPPQYVPPPQPSWPGTSPAHQQFTSRATQPQRAPEVYEQPASAFVPAARVQAEQREMPPLPAWLNPEKAEAPAAAATQRVSEDTLQGSRDRLASRWYALRGVFDSVPALPEAVPSAPPTRAPVVAVFSLAGGVGKTSLAATLGRALSSRGERVLLVDTAPYGLMPFYFGAHDQRPGVLRTFSPPGTSSDAPIQMVTIDPETLGPETAGQELLSTEITKYSRGNVSRIIVDLATASGATTRRILRMSPLVLVPMVPDMNSVVSVSSIDSFFQHNISTSTKQVMPFYILNQFDSSLPLHLDIREILREQLGDRLLPLALRRTPAVSEALAEGMTVMDYAPNSTVAEDFANLAGWVKSQSAPASSAYRGVRWSER